ncbi:MAG TPA: hypothetical protein ENO05_08045 [Bacteroides sp.]|nr:hypothetical protein [Bacteroides sp.]
MTNSGPFSTMDAERLRQVNGGGFAYDVGRVLRFISLCGHNFSTVNLAIIDWQVNAELNDAANN